MKRRLLIVTDLDWSTFSALKRGLAYVAHFAAHATWSAEFIDRKAPTVQTEAAGVLRRVARRLGVAPSAAPATPLRRSIDDEIVDRAKSVDLVYLLKIPTIEVQRRILALQGPRVVVDLNDALWLPHHEGFRDLGEMLTTAHGVFCENNFGAQYAAKFNQNVQLVPDCTQLATFDALRNDIRRGSPVRLGWIGSPGTAGFLYKIWEPLEELFTRHVDLELRLVGASAQHVPHFERVRWSAVLKYDREQMVREALAMDIGLFPLFNVEDSLGRGNGKAVTYMAAGAVAACSNIGEHTRLIRDGHNGILADNDREWVSKLDALISDVAVRNRIAAAGLQTIRDTLTDEMCFRRLIHACDESLERS